MAEQEENFNFKKLVFNSKWVYLQADTLYRRMLQFHQVFYILKKLDYNQAPTI